MSTVRVGTAGWSLSRAPAGAFPPDGSHLQRYAARLNCAEINSSFYRPHRAATYARWADSVPDDFRFAVKAPRAITHDARLQGVVAQLEVFLGQAGGLGNKLGCLLLQLPPSFAFDRAVVARFLGVLRRRWNGAAVFEPRHASWFDGRADELLAQHRISRVAADPAVVAAAAAPGGYAGCCYLRLHGSPDMYYSSYAQADLRAFARRLRAARAAGADCWCIFDNTARGAALPNALRMRSLLARR